MKLHKLLEKQIQRCLSGSISDYPELQKLLVSVSDSYHSFERDKELTDQAFLISEEEFGTLNQQLKKEIEVKKQSVENLKEAIGSIHPGENPADTDDLLMIAQHINLQVNKRKNAELVFNSLISNMQSGVLLEDENRQIVYINQFFCDLFAITQTPAELQGCNYAVIAEQCRQQFQSPEKFLQSVNSLLQEQQLKTDEVLTFSDGRMIQLDYIPIHQDGQYKGHLFKYTDITEKKKAQEEIEKSELTRRLILGAALDAIIIINPRYEITFWNTQAEKIFGWQEQEVMGKSIARLLGSSASRNGCGLEQSLKPGAGKGVNKVMELTATKKNGQEFPIELSIVPVMHESEIFFCGFIRDISERTKAQDELRASQERWQFALEGSGDGIWQFDFTTREIFFSKQYKKLLGYEEHEFKSNTRNWLLHIHPEDREMVVRISKNYINKTITSHEIEYRMLHKDGQYIWVLDRGKVFQSDANHNDRIIGTNTNITERKKTEEEYRRISVVASANENGVVFTDTNGCITWANEGFTRLTHYSVGETLGHNPFDLCKGPLSDRSRMKEVADAFMNGRSFNSEIIHYRKDGSWFWGRVRGQAVTNAQGKVMLYFAIIYDISNEKDSQRKLKEYEERLKMALTNVGDNYWEHDFTTGKTYFSNATGNILGFTKEELADEGSSWWKMLHPEDRKAIEENDLQYKAGLIDHHEHEYRIISKDGRVHWILDRGMVTEKDDKGIPVKIIGTHIDITRQKELELELSRRANQFKSLSESIPGVIYEYEFRTDGTEGLRYVSPAMQQIFGIQPHEFYDFQKYVHPEDAAAIKEMRVHTRASLEPFYAEARLLMPGKEVTWYSLSSSFSYYSPEGNAVFTGFMLNITERKTAEEALKRNEEKYRNIIANMNLGLLEVDNDSVIRFSNQSFSEMSGYTAEELTGNKADDLFLQQMEASMKQELMQKRQKGHSDVYEMAVTNKKGEAKWWLISGAPLYNDKREITGSIGIHLDITNQKNLEYELLASREQAELSAKAKQTFLVNMSHEIRTPMNAILGMSRQLQKTMLNNDQKLYVNTINNAGEHLMVIINDILDMTKIEAGKLTIEKIGFNMTELIKNTVDVMQHRASEKGLLIRFGIDPNIANCLMGDPFRLKQILLNLMSNAVKFSERGDIEITALLQAETLSQQSLLISVKDTGIGMEKEFLDKLFQSFTQEDKSVSRKYGGTGLGMTITKQLTELMAGVIEVESEKNVGTTIRLSIPFEKGKDSDLPVEEIKTSNPEALKGKHILLVEDNDINRMIATITLGQYQATYTEAVNGEEAVKAVKNGQFDLILMDMQMPVMDGIEATKLIRNELLCNTPIIALTANAIKGESEKCFDAGMDDFISKPFDEDTLIAKIEKWINKQPNAFIQ